MSFSSCIGTTTVNLKVFNADEEQIFQWDLKVKVKKNAADVTVTGIADGDKFSVGQEIPVTLPRQGVDTDERELTVDKTDIVELKTGEKARTYTVKFLKAGEATFTAKAYQSAKFLQMQRLLLLTHISLLLMRTLKRLVSSQRHLTLRLMLCTTWLRTQRLASLQ